MGQQAGEKRPVVVVKPGVFCEIPQVPGWLQNQACEDVGPALPAHLLNLTPLKKTKR